MSTYMAVLREAFPDWIQGQAIFSYLERMGNMPWASDINPLELDLQYYGNHSGSKFCSPLVMRLIQESNLPTHALDGNSMENLSNVIIALYLNNWTHLWGTYTLRYSALESYDVTISRTLSTEGEKSKEGSSTLTKTGTDTIQRGTTETTSYGKRDAISYGRTDSTIYGKVDTMQYGKSSDVSESVYGFNSAAASPSNKRVTTDSGSDVDTLSGTDSTTQGGTDTRTFGGSDSTAQSGSDVNTKNLTDTGSNLESETEEATETEEITKKGSNGVYTKQRLILEERGLWVTSFFEQVFKDIDSVLALQYFDPCRV